MKPRQIEKSNVVLGAGAFFIDEIVSGGYLGERYLGDTTVGSISTAVERTEVFAGDGPVGERLVSLVRQVTRSMSVTVQDMSPENLALLVAGTATRSDKAVVAVVNEIITVRKGRWYTLGQTAAKPGGAGAVGAASNAQADAADEAGKRKTVVANVGNNDGRGNTYYEEGDATDGSDDYVLDAETGRIWINPAGEIADGAKISVAYAPTALGAKEKVGVAKTGAARQIRGAIRYVEEAAAGRGRNIYARRCSISAAGETALKNRDTPQTITLGIEVEEPLDDYPAMSIDGVVV